MPRQRSAPRKRSQMRKKRSVNRGMVLTVSRVSITSVAKAATTAGTGLYLTHSLNNFPGVGDITSLFQEFKIQSIKLTFRLVNAPNNNAAFPTLYIAPQRFNFVQPGAVPTSVQDVWQFRGMKTYQFGPTALSYSQTFTPHYSLDVNNQALSTGEVRKAAWLGAAANAVNHASAVYWIDRYDTPTNNSHTIELETVLVLKCRGPK